MQFIPRSTVLDLPPPRVPVLLADPPWEYKVWSEKGKGRSADKHYKTQNLDWIKSMPIKELLCDDAVVCMWATAPNLVQALEVGAAWGLTYKTVLFTWAKTNKNQVHAPASAEKTWFFGQGYYTRANAEFVLLFTIGEVLKRKSRSVRQLVTAPMTRHSEKPEIVQDRIEMLFEGPYTELFARRKRSGWYCWGNEINSDFEWVV